MHLSVIAKEPLPGFVKTRLCPPCTPEQAATIAAASLLDTLDSIDALTIHATALGYTVKPKLIFEGDATNWLRPGYTVVVQRGGGLEERLANAFNDLGPGFIVGMESPRAVASIASALQVVAEGEDALGLAEDGGYWGIGLGSVDPNVFTGVPMSASNTGLAQLRRLHELNRSVYLLPQARDLDTIEDVEAAAQRGGNNRLESTAREVLGDLARMRYRRESVQ
jgi:uncharacterized protein